jgi:ureidoglycolate lyase
MKSVDATRSLVALSGDDDLPNSDTLCAFVSDGGQGVCYRRGVPHFAFTSLDEVNEVVVIMSEAGDDHDTVVVDLAQPVRVDLRAKSAPAVSEITL